jgi:hypothetical protein
MRLLNMMNTLVGLYFDRCLALLKSGLAVSLVFLLPTMAQAMEEDMVGNPNGLVEVHLRADPYASYSKRRTHWGFRLNLQWENFYPSNYVSPADQAPYSNIFGSNQGSIVSLGLGEQYNSPIGALYVDGVFGAGTIPGVISNTGMTINKYGVVAGILLDRFFENPWVSPFVAIQCVSFKWNDLGNGSGGATASSSTAPTLGYMAGVSIHMNRVDEVGAAEAYIDYGIKNSFIDIYMIEYATSSSAQDPNLQTSPSIGAGFHLEF